MEPLDRDELAAFLRTRRAAVRPEDVGLPTGPRRRVPGLRRQEVAERAGMSVDYYIRLEQGRGPRPSRSVLTAVGRALQLSEHELAYLMAVAGQPAPRRTGPAAEPRPGVLRMLERLDDVPALVCDARYDVLAWNPMAAALLGELTALPADRRNVVERFFTDPEARERHDARGRAEFARVAVSDLREATARYPDDSRLRSLVRRLRHQSTEFDDLWQRRDLDVHRSASKRIRHPELGWLELDCEALHDPEGDHWVIVYTAAPGTPSYEALRLLRVLGTESMPGPPSAHAPVATWPSPGVHNVTH